MSLSELCKRDALWTTLPSLDTLKNSSTLNFKTKLISYTICYKATCRNTENTEEKQNIYYESIPYDNFPGKWNYALSWNKR